MTDIRLTVQGLAVDYPTARVVDNVNFTLGNERLALVGRLQQAGVEVNYVTPQGS